MKKKEILVKDEIEQIVRRLLDTHGEMSHKEIEEDIVKKGFKISTYVSARKDWKWIDCRKEMGNRTYWFAKKQQTSIPPPHKQNWSLPSVVLRTLSADQTIRMCRTIGTTDPLICHLLELLEREADKCQERYDEGYNDGYNEGHNEGYEKAKEKVMECMDKVEGYRTGCPLVKSAFDELRDEIEQLSSID